MPVITTGFCSAGQVSALLRFPSHQVLSQLQPLELQGQARCPLDRWVASHPGLKQMA